MINITSSATSGSKHEDDNCVNGDKLYLYHDDTGDDDDDDADDDAGEGEAEAAQRALTKLCTRQLI